MRIIRIPKLISLIKASNKCKPIFPGTISTPNSFDEVLNYQNEH